MTGTRRRALQWFYDRGAVLKSLAESDAPSAHMISLMQSEDQLHLTEEGWCLTDKGRRDLWEDRA